MRTLLVLGVLLLTACGEATPYSCEKASSAYSVLYDDGVVRKSEVYQCSDSCTYAVPVSIADQPTFAGYPEGALRICEQR